MKKIARFWTREFFIDNLLVLVGTAIFGLGLHVFTIPNRIAPGGLSGVATIANYLFGIPVGLFFLLVNIPLLLIGLKYLGKKFLFRTLISSLFMSYVLDVVYVKIPTYEGQGILASVFGGLLIGFGVALTYMRGGSTGGMDIVNMIIQKKIPHLKLGVVSFITDFIVVLISLLTFQDFEAALFAVTAIFVSSQIMDRILYGADKGKMLLIITHKPEKMSAEIIEQLAHGSTIINAKGAFSGEERTVLLCAISNNQIYKIKKIVLMVDPSAFVIVGDASEIRGEGFKSLENI